MPFMVFCLSGISAGCLGLLLPETLNKPAAETLDELSSPKYQRILDPQVTMGRNVLLEEFIFWSTYFWLVDHSILRPNVFVQFHVSLHLHLPLCIWLTLLSIVTYITFIITVQESQLDLFFIMDCRVCFLQVHLLEDKHLIDHNGADSD